MKGLDWVLSPLNSGGGWPRRDPPLPVLGGAAGPVKVVAAVADISACVCSEAAIGSVSSGIASPCETCLERLGAMMGSLGFKGYFPLSITMWWSPSARSSSVAGSTDDSQVGGIGV